MLPLPLLTLLAIVSPGIPASAQRVVVLQSSDATAYAQTGELLLQHLQTTDRKPDSAVLSRLDDAERDALLDTDDAVFVAVGSAAATWLHPRLRPGQELVYCMVSDPDGSGLTKGPAAHGVAMTVPIAEQLQLLARGLPGPRRIGVLYRRDDARCEARLSELRRGLPPDCELVCEPIAGREHVGRAIDKLLQRDVDVIHTVPDPVIHGSASVRTLLVKSLRQRTPVFGYSHAFVRAGALFGVGIDPATLASQTAELVESVLEGKLPPGTDGRVLVPVRYGYSVNLIVADRLGVDLPEDFVARADLVIRRPQ